MNIILKAADFAARKHVNQRRKNQNKDPYINHPIGVAKWLSECGIDDPEILVAALLHDVLEDTNTTVDELKKLFGERVTKLVLECSDDKSKGKVERKKLQLLHASTISFEAKLIKLADKWFNLFDEDSGLVNNAPAGWSHEEVYGCICWSYAVCKTICKSTEDVPGIKNMMQLFNKEIGDEISSLSEDKMNEQLEAYYKKIDHSD
jgi:guanosine-3',5'-bis(diphosphate) 3'-pyrophosphohydrolase